MKNHPLIFVVLLLLIGRLDAANENKTRVLFNSLNVSSVAQHLAFYQLYSDTSEGRKALNHVWYLLSPPNEKEQHAFQILPDFSPATNAIINLVNKQSDETTSTLTDSELRAIDELARSKSFL